MNNQVTKRFQELADHFDYPMFIVTAAVGDRRAGCLVGFCTQCSIAAQAGMEISGMTFPTNRPASAGSKCASAERVISAAASAGLHATL